MLGCRTLERSSSGTAPKSTVHLQRNSVPFTLYSYMDRPWRGNGNIFLQIGVPGLRLTRTHTRGTSYQLFLANLRGEKALRRRGIHTICPYLYMDTFVGKSGNIFFELNSVRDTVVFFLRK